MKVTDLIEKSDRITESWLLRGMIQDLEDCGCLGCVAKAKVLKAKMRKELLPEFY